MARSPPCRKAPLLAAALLSAAVAPAVGAADAAAPPAPPPAQQPINLDAASTEVDGRTNTLVFTDVVISQGATRVQAEHARATGLNFANSRWTFDGKVRIDAELHGNLRSDQATIEFRDNHIARASCPESVRFCSNSAGLPVTVARAMWLSLNSIVAWSERRLPCSSASMRTYS